MNQSCDKCISVLRRQNFSFAVQQHIFGPVRPRGDSPGSHWKKVQMSILSIVHWFEAWRRYRSAVTELSQLDERDLAELGMTREEIREVARQSAGLRT